MNFFDTVAGHNFTNYTIPKLIDNLEKLNNSLERIANALENTYIKEKEQKN